MIFGLLVDLIRGAITAILNVLAPASTPPTATSAVQPNRAPRDPNS